MIPWFDPGCFHGAHGTRAPFILERAKLRRIDVDRGSGGRCKNRATGHSGASPNGTIDPLWQRGQDRGGGGVDNASVPTGEPI
jgi:hypothetical protein